MDKGQIKELGDGNENGDAVNIKQLNEVESNVENYVNAEVKGVNDAISKLKPYFRDEINRTIVEHSFENFLLCLYYLDSDQYPNSTKLSKWGNRRRTPDSLDAVQSNNDRRPTVDNDLEISYLSFDRDDYLEVPFSLNKEEYLNVFLVFRVFEPFGQSSGKVIINGIFGGDDGHNGIFVTVDQTKDDYTLGVGFGGGDLTLSSFPSRASPVTLNFSALSVHYTVSRENTSTIWCNGKRIDTFQRENLSGNDSKFYIGRTGSTQTSNNNNNKEIAYFSIVI